MKKNIFPLILVIAILTVVLLGCAQTKTEIPKAATSDTVQISDDGPEEQTTVAVDKEKEKMVGEEEIEVIETDPSKGEYFVYAILEEIYTEDNLIKVMQLFNDPSDKEIDPVVSLEKDCLIVKVTYTQAEDSSSQTSEELEKISIDDIKEGSEIGIIFTADDRARAILYLTDPFIE